jgi:hypothetical protein
MRRESAGTLEFAAAEYDPLDLHIQRLGVSRRSTWSKVSSQGALLLLTGITLGPQGLAILTAEILEVLQPAVPVALAALGVTAAFGSAKGHRLSRRTSLLTAAVILVVGLASALQQRTVVDALTMVLQAAAIAALLAAAGWDLSSGAGDEERRVFAIATMLLLGGVAEFLSVSALFLGWVAASAWRLWRTEVEQVRIDAAYVRHPVTALLLVMAGAGVVFTWQTVALAALTAGGMLTVVLLVRRRRGGGALTGGGAPLPLATFAVALAMDAARVDGRLAAMLSIVVLAAAVFDALSAIPRENSA